jgi:hypothetical protein
MREQTLKSWKTEMLKFVWLSPFKVDRALRRAMPNNRGFAA